MTIEELAKIHALKFLEYLRDEVQLSGLPHGIPLNSNDISPYFLKFYKEALEIDINCLRINFNTSSITQEVDLDIETVSIVLSGGTQLDLAAKSYLGMEFPRYPSESDDSYRNRILHFANELANKDNTSSTSY